MLSDSTTVGIDPDTGKILWKYPPGKGGDPAKAWKPDIPIPSPLSLGDGRFFLTEGYSAGSVMIKVTKSGDTWDVAEVYKTKACGAQIHLPLLIDGYLYINSNSNDRREGLLCLRPDDGKVMWQTNKSPSFERGNLIYADGVIYIMEGAPPKGSPSGMLRIVQPSPEGYKQLAEAKLLEGENIWSPMAISDGLLFCRDQKQMKCVDIRGK
jgi:outer membrane protein assembly factor BamB